MSKPIISVCISVYNGGDYLNRCLDSVVAQNILNMEIILVDDGSTDNSLQVMREYEAKYSAIRVVEQKHAGLAKGRMTGVHYSSGQYVTFLDVDDYLLDGAYETILQFMKETKADIYEFQTIREDYYSSSPYSGMMEAKQVLKEYFEGTDIPVNFWLRWYKHEILTDDIFPVGISLHEDVYAFPCILNKARTIAYINKPLHVHMRNAFSIMGRFRELRNTKEYFEGQKTLLLSIPHIKSSIGESVLNGEYETSFKHYVYRLCRNFMFSNFKDVTYDEKIDAILKTLNLSITRKEFEKEMAKNSTMSGKTDRLIKYLGLKYTVKVYGIYRRLQV